MREIVLDTETTGLDPADGHRIVEIACIELVNHLPTGQDLPPLRQSRARHARRGDAVHGLAGEFLAQHPVFAEIADDFLAFVGSRPAGDPQRRIRSALRQCRAEAAGARPLACAVEDTLLMARKRFPGAPASLDALCRRFAIDLSAREQARRPDRLRAARRGLSRTDRRPPARPRTRRGDRRGRATRLAATAARPPRPHAPAPRSSRRTPRLLAKLKAPLWIGRSDGGDDATRSRSGRAGLAPAGGAAVRRNRRAAAAAAGSRRRASRSR